MICKVSTAVTLIVGPILDSTGAEYASAVIGDLSISKNGATLTALASAATLTIIANGQYTLVLTTGNTDTLGAFQITCNKSTYQMGMIERQVVPATVYDALVTNAAGGANGLVLSKANNIVDANVISVGPTGANTAQTARDIGLALPAVAPNSAGGLLITAAGSLDMDELNVDIEAIETRVTLALPNAAPQAAGGLITSTAGSLDIDDLAADVDATETRVTTALPNAAPNAAGGLLITTAGSLDMDDLAADVDATETRVTTALPNAAPQAAGGLITSIAGSLDLDEMNVDIEAIQAQAALIPAAPASTTNITGGVITTVTNLTNAPTSGDLTTTMKTSVQAAADAAVTANALVLEIEADTDTLTAGVTVTTNSDKTGYALTSAYDFAKGTVAMTESYNADGAAPTPVQSLMGIMQMLMEMSAAGTVITVKKLDGTTTAFTLATNDATTPTSITRSG